MSCEIPGRVWESVGADIFTINNNHYLCIVDYHHKFWVMEQVGGFSADNLIKKCKIIFSEYGLPTKIVSDTGINFISQKFEDSFRHRQKI